MGEYYTTVKTINADGKTVKSFISCGGDDKGFTDEKTGEITFVMYSESEYAVYAKRYGTTISGKVRGGKKLLLRFD